MKGVLRNDMRNGNKSSHINSGGEGFQLLTGDKYETVSMFMRSHGSVNTPPDTSDKSPPWLLCDSGSYTTYCPLQIKELHRKFGSLNDTNSIIDFANRYGPLGTDIMLVPVGGGNAVLGESITRWQYESRDMGTLLAIWDMIQTKDAGGLTNIIIWPKTNKVALKLQSTYNDSQKRWVVNRPNKKRLLPGSKGHILSSPHINPELLNQWQRGDIIEPAKYYICLEVNRHLRTHVTPQILPFLEDKVYLHPDSLLSALWVLFLNELTGTKFRQCDLSECREWKEYKINRKTFYCSDACRQKAYRIRHPGIKGGKSK